MVDKGADLAELEKLTLGSLRRAVFDGNTETGSFMAGQISGLVKQLRPIRQVLSDLFDGVDSYRQQLEIL